MTDLAQFHALGPRGRAYVYERASAAEAALLQRDWSLDRRIAQQPPEGDWRVWLLMAGRGFGKTRAGAEWVRGLAESDGALRIALIGAGLAEARAVMVEGPSGLLAIAPRGARPDWEPSLRRLRWPNGAVAHLYSAAEPESLRGPEHHAAWGDEVAKWPHGLAAWDNLMLGLRCGDRPRAVATTTPRPVPLLRALLAQGDVIVTRGATEENARHLPRAWLVAMRDSYGGTRLGRQELDGELIEEAEDALWTRDLLERCRVRRAPAFRLRDPFDDSSGGMTGDPGFADQALGTGDGVTTRFDLVKRYGNGEEAEVRRITRPVAGSLRVGVGGVEQASGWSLIDGGTILFASAPAVGAAVSAGFRFDVPVRFAEDRLEVNRASFLAGEAPSVPLIEVREG